MPAKRSMSPALLVMLCATISACGQPEHLQIASDGCLNFKRISAEVDPARVDQGERSEEDKAAGNQYDTEQTVGEVLEHNEVYDRLCSPPEKQEG